MTRLGLLTVGGALMALAIAGSITEAWAACPPGTRYACVQGYGGKVVCSCS